MKKEVLENIVNAQKDLKNLQNNILVEYMDVLSQEFETIKSNLIQQTYYLDKIEELYNNILKVYQERGNGSK